MSDDRKAALDNALKKIEKNFGKGSIMRMGDKADTRISTVPTGSLSLDEALGVGGFPRGRIVEIYGPESSGKTTVALHAVAEVQKRGGTAAYIDAENALDLLMHRRWVLISMNYCCRSLTRENRDLRFVTHWFHPVRLT